MKVIKEIQVTIEDNITEIEVISNAQANPDYTLVLNEEVENGLYTEDILDFIPSIGENGVFTLLVEFKLLEVYSYDSEKDIEVYSINVLESHFQKL